MCARHWNEIVVVETARSTYERDTFRIGIMGFIVAKRTHTHTSPYLLSSMKRRVKKANSHRIP